VTLKVIEALKGKTKKCFCRLFRVSFASSADNLVPSLVWKN